MCIRDRFYGAIMVLDDMQATNMYKVSNLMLNLVPQWSLLAFYITGFSLVEYLLR